MIWKKGKNNNQKNYKKIVNILDKRYVDKI